MIEPTDVVYTTADDQQLGPAELEELIETEECAVELYRGTDAILSVAEPRRFEARGVDARVRHPSVAPADAFIEVEFRATLRLPRDRCHPRGATPPARPVSTAKRDIIEAVRDSDADDADDDGAQDGVDTPETWESSSLTTKVSSDAEEVTSPDADPHGSDDEPATSGCPQSQPESSDGADHDEDVKSGDDDGDTKIALRDGEFVEIPDDDAE